VLIGAHSQAVRHHTVKHCPIRVAVKEAATQQSTAEACNSVKSLGSQMPLSLFELIHRISGGKAPHHDTMIRFGQRVQKTIHQVNRMDPVAAQHMYITESVRTVASRRNSEGRAA